MTGAHIFDSEVYGSNWATAEVRQWFTDEGRTQAWLEILAALAAAQADLGIVPDAAAEQIAERALVESIDMERYASLTASTSHSTLGLIHAFREALDPAVREWVYHGATVQDLTDTWTGLVAKRMLGIVERDLGEIEAELARAAVEHRDTVMAGRTHGQVGLPISYGFKLAVWVAELRRHRERVAQALPRLAVGQLCGAVGTASFWPGEGIELQRRFCARLGLTAPEIAWLTARDRVAELAVLLAMVSGTLGKIGNEVYNLQRPEIGELGEPAQPGAVGSITMPHKRNPERSEQLGSLARVVRATAGLGLEGMIHEHERDGAAWKTEWAFVPEACLATSASLRLGRELVEGLRPNPERMRRNLDLEEGYPASEAIVRELTPQLGKHRAHEVVHAAAMAGRNRGESFFEALLASAEVTSLLGEERIGQLLDPGAPLRCAGEFVDRVCVAMPAESGKR